VGVDGRGADGVAGNRVVSLLAGRVDGMFDDNMDGTPKPPPPSVPVWSNFRYLPTGEGGIMSPQCG
jgi:hypothetical protein